MGYMGGIVFSVYNIPTAESKRSDSLAQGENTSSENSPGHGNAQNRKIRARGSFWVTRFIYLRLMWQVMFRGLFSEKMKGNVHMFGKISVQEWGRGGRWGVQGSESYALYLVFECIKSY